MANTFLRHLALQDSKKGNLHAFKEKDPKPQGCQQHNRSPEDCLVLSLFCIYTVIKQQEFLKQEMAASDSAFLKREFEVRLRKRLVLALFI